METRRQVLKSISLLGVAASAPATASVTGQIDECDFYAKKLAAAMSQKYGGEWTMHLMPTNDAILVCRS